MTNNTYLYHFGKLLNELYTNGYCNFTAHVDNTHCSLCGDTWTVTPDPETGLLLIEWGDLPSEERLTAQEMLDWIFVVEGL